MKTSYPTFFLIFIVFAIGLTCCKKQVGPGYDFTWTGDTLTGKPILFIPYKSVVGAGSLLWDFGDNTTSTDFNPTHVYTLGATYTVSLTVNGDKAHTATKKISIYPDVHLDLLTGTHLFHHYNTDARPWPPYHATTYVGDVSMTISEMSAVVISIAGNTLSLNGGSGDSTVIFTGNVPSPTDNYALSLNTNSGAIVYTHNYHVSAAAGDGHDDYYAP